MAAPDAFPPLDTLERPLLGGDVFVLSGKAECWVVSRGMVSVHWTRMEAGVARGQRRFLGCLTPGSVVFPVFPQDGLEDFAFVLSGSEASLSRADFSDMDPERLAGALESWARLLTDHALESRPLYTATIVAESGAHPLEAGQTLRVAGKGLAVARVSSGMAIFMGEFSATVDDGTGVLAVAESAWFEAVDGLTLEIMRIDSVEPGDAIAFAKALNQAFAQMVLSVALSEDVIERRRQLQRRQTDEESTSRAMLFMSDVIRGARSPAAGGGRLAEVMGLIGNRQGIDFICKSDGPWSSEHPVEAVCRASRVRFRFVRLPAGWWSLDAGPMLGFARQGNELLPVALVRDGSGRYVLLESAAGPPLAVDEKSASTLSEQAVVFYRPFPVGRVTLKTLFVFIVRGIIPELGWLVGAGIAMAAFGMALPLLTRHAVDTAIPDGDTAMLATIVAGLAVATICQIAFSLFEQCLIIRLRALTKVGLQAAVVDRLLSLPAPFFKRFDNGELLTRVMMISQVGNMASGTALFALFSGIMSISNFIVLFQFSSAMALAVAAYAAATALATMAISILVRRMSIEIEQVSGKLAGFLVQLIQGVSRLRVAGAGRRAFNQWLARFTEQVKLIGRVRLLEDCERVLNLVLGQVSSIAVMFMAFSLSASRVSESGQGMSIGSYMAFMASYGALSGGIASASHAVVVLMEAFSKMRLVDPILSEPVESSRADAVSVRLSGGISVEKLSFRYGEGLPLVIHDLSFTVHPGQFVAIVGSSGCGKSTLVRLLLGLEKPLSGSVLYDGRNLDGLDLPSVRRQIGVVMQTPRVAAGSIFDNIAFGNPITMEQAMAAAKAAGMADDIAQMPMGMQTLVSEGGGNISGGQRQRLMIARAMAANPKIMIFDEATSALDNITQDIVSRSLAALKVTRITVAHRLSTIRSADLILVMENGRVTDSGNFNQLMAREGPFRAMASRQMS